MQDLFVKLRIYGIKKFLIYSLHELYLKTWMQKIKNSYSQSREDIIVDKILGNKKRGFYIDVGANDPIRFNNTFRFYKRGWRGINIEPDPDSFARIVKERSRDLNLNIGIGNSNSKMLFYKFIPDTLSTFSEKAAKKYKKQGFKLIAKIPVEVRKLSDILELYCKDRHIDFISIDTEGYDLTVLKSNNWKLFRPKVICVEAAEKNIAGEIVKNKSEISDYLLKNKYREFLNNGLNKIFVDTYSLRGPE